MFLLNCPGLLSKKFIDPQPDTGIWNSGPPVHLGFVSQNSLNDDGPSKRHLLHWRFYHSFSQQHHRPFNSILKTRALRLKKEYLVVVGLSIADVIFGLSYIWMGLYRLYLISNNQQHDLISVWECMKQPRVIVTHYGVQLALVMLTCISVDRLLSVMFPFWYFTRTVKYAYGLVGGFYLLVLINCSALVYVSYTKRNIDFCPKTCLGGKILGKGMATTYSFTFCVLCGCLSVFLYFLIPFVYRCHNADDKEKFKTQKRLMKTLGISAILTFSFYVMSNLVKIVVVDLLSGEMWSIFGPYVTCLTLVNPMANFFLYTLRHKEIRNAIMALIKFYKPKKNVVVPAGVAGRKTSKRLPNNAVTKL